MSKRDYYEVLGVDRQTEAKDKKGVPKSRDEVPS